MLIIVPITFENRKIAGHIILPFYVEYNWTFLLLDGNFLVFEDDVFDINSC